MPQEEPPSYSHAQSHDPNVLTLPSIPSADPQTVPAPTHHERTLPPLPLAPAESRYRPEEPLTAWPSSNPLTAYYKPGPSQLSPKTGPAMGMDSPSRTDVDTVDSRGRRGGSVLSIDDPDVRLAAEALGDLRAGMPHMNYLCLYLHQLTRSRFCTVTRAAQYLVTPKFP
jgi:hypothetical protein